MLFEAAAQRDPEGKAAEAPRAGGLPPAADVAPVEELEELEELTEPASSETEGAATEDIGAGDGASAETPPDDSPGAADEAAEPPAADDLLPGEPPADGPGADAPDRA
jgi:hypothetical protein